VPDAIKLLNVSWTDFKTFQTRDSFTVYYVDGTNSIEAIGVTVKWTYYVKISGADLTDFNTNYLSAAVSVPAIDDAIATANLTEVIDVEITSSDPGGNSIVNVPLESSDMKYLYADYTTTSSSEQTALSHVVATGKTFYMIYYSVHVGSGTGSNTFGKLKIKAGTAIRDSINYDSGSSVASDVTTYIEYRPSIPIPFADSGTTISVTIDEIGGSGGNHYHVTVYGFEITPPT